MRLTMHRRGACDKALARPDVMKRLADFGLTATRGAQSAVYSPSAQSRRMARHSVRS